MACLSKITFHWTAGASIPCATDLKHYHYVIDSNGILYKGIYRPEDNINCNDGKYAAHCGGGNTGNIGIAFCGCYVPNGVSVKNTKFPLTRIQLERGFELGAELCKKYNISVNPDNVFTHYEFGKKHPKTLSAGKIDITYMHPFPLEKDCGQFIRNKIKWYLNKI